MTQEGSVPPDFWARVQQVAERAVDRYARSGASRNMSISGGSGLEVTAGSKLRIRHPSGGTMLLAGVFDANHSYDRADGSYQPMCLLYRSDGTIALSMFDSQSGGGGQQYIAMWDRSGNVVFSDDTNSGQGMARPYLSGSFSAARFTDFRYTVTSTTFETVAEQYITKQQPRLQVRAKASMDTSGATGEMRVLVDGVQLGATTSESFAIATRDYGPVAFTGTHMQVVRVEIQGRVTSAGGSLKIEPLRWQTVQS